MKRTLINDQLSTALPIRRGGTGGGNTKEVADSLDVIERGNEDIIPLDASGKADRSLFQASMLASSGSYPVGFNLKKLVGDDKHYDSNDTVMRSVKYYFEITDYDSNKTYTVTPLQNADVAVMNGVCVEFTARATDPPGTTPMYGFTLTAGTQSRKVELQISA